MKDGKISPPINEKGIFGGDIVTYCVKFKYLGKLARAAGSDYSESYVFTEITENNGRKSAVARQRLIDTSCENYQYKDLPELVRVAEQVGVGPAID